MRQRLQQVTYVMTALLLIALPTLVSAAPAVVGTSASAMATAAGAGGNRKTFYDDVNHTHWVAYYNGSAIEFAYTDSLESGVWQSAGTLGYNTSDFVISYKTISGVPYIVVAAAANTYDIVLRRGVVGSSSIAFDAEVTALNGTAADDAYSAPSIALDGNNRLWVGAVWDKYLPTSTQGPDDKVVSVVRSINSVGADLSLFAAATRLGKPDRERTSVAIAAKGGDRMYLLSGQSSNNLEAWEYDGSAWQPRNTGGDMSWLSMDGFISFSSAPAIAVGGDGVYVGGGALYRWDGISWEIIGRQGIGAIYSIAISGTDIYLGGFFFDAAGLPGADNIIRWDGTNWQELGTGLNSAVRALAISGADLYVGGAFTDAGGNALADYFARWDGSSWQPVGGGLNGQVGAIALSGSDIYVGGAFTDAGGNVNCDKIARWDGTSWNPLGAGVGSAVNAIAVSGADVYVGGMFLDAGGIAAADYIARWDGVSWNALGAGLGGGVNPGVHSIAVSGSDVYAAGGFTFVSGTTAKKIARWDGASWNEMGPALDITASVVVASGSDVYVGGQFTNAGGVELADSLARWDGTSWYALGGGVDGAVRAIAEDGTDIYLGGDFTNLGGDAAADYFVRWDGSAWRSVGGGVNGSVAALAISGIDVYVGGSFTDAGGIAAADYIARWDGSAWRSVGGGVNGSVAALAISGTDVYVGGSFTDAGGIAAADYVARWDGSNWQALGLGVNSQVRAITVSGTDVYLGGNFTDAGGNTAADYVARWDGANWQPLGSGLTSLVEAIAVSGTDIYVGGWFLDAGGIAAADYIARWDGSFWNALGAGVNNRVLAMTVSGSELYAGGDFTDAGGVPGSSGVARWDGGSWSALGKGVLGGVSALSASSSTIYVGGSFSYNGDLTDFFGHFAWYAPTASADFGVDSQLSMAVDLSGDMHLLSNSANELTYRRYDDTSSAWQPSVTVESGSTIDSFSVTQTASGDLQALWLDSNQLKRKAAIAPYSGADWQVVADTLYNSGANQHLTLSSSEQWGRVPYFWTNGAGAPYDVYVDYFDFTHSISGHVDNSGSGLANVVLDVGIHGSATTDVGGNYTISGIPWGMGYTVTPILSSYSFTPVSATGTMTANVTADFGASLDLGIIAGVVEQNGTPVAGATVTLVTTAGTFIAVTGSNGSYSFGGLAPGVGAITVEKGGVQLAGGTVNVMPGTTVVPILEITDPRLSSPLYTYWNGFLDMVNVLELINPGASEVVVDVTLHDIDGGVVATKQLRISAGNQRDVIINDLPGFSVGSYGLVTVDAGSSEVDGRMTYYRLAGDTWGDDYDFVYSLELMPGMSGETIGVWNTHLGQQNSSSAAIFGAELELDIPVTTISTATFNWLSVANLDSVSRNFVTTWREQTGDSITTTTLRIPPFGKRDIQAGHEFSVAGGVGLISITPEDNSVPYIATLSRYGDNFAFASSTTQGTEAVTMLPAGGEGLNVLELANASNTDNDVQLTWYDMNGDLLKTEVANLSPYAQQHFIPIDVLPAGSYGSVRITPAGKVIAGAASYLDDDSGGIATAHYLTARESFGRVFSGTFNTYLDMYNWLRVTNNSEMNQNALIDFGGGKVEHVFIPARGRRDVLIPTGSDTGHSYGSFTLESTLSGVLSASVVRSRESGRVVDFQSVVGLR